MNPDYPAAQNALGHLLLSQGKRAEAEKVFAVATKLTAQAGPDQPRTWRAALNTALMYYNDHDLESALTVLRQARAEFRDTWLLIKLESEVLRAAHKNNEALALVEEFSHRNWWHAAAAISLGRIYLDENRFEEAGAALHHASRLDVHDAESLNLIAHLDVRQNRFQQAYLIQRRAIARQPDEPRQYLILSDILTKWGRLEEARAALAQASAMKAIVEAPIAIN
jgi:predicted Zn-dependent protease